MESVSAINNGMEVEGKRELERIVILDVLERPVHFVGVTDGYQAIRRPSQPRIPRYANCVTRQTFA
jgi:hypothetical protein